YLVPTLVPSLPSWWKSFLPDQAIRLGLDLQGGMHLVLEVQTEKALEFSVERSVEDLKRELAGALGEGAKSDEVVGVVEDRFPTFQRGGGEEAAGQVKFTLTTKEIDRIR